METVIIHSSKHGATTEVATIITERFNQERNAESCAKNLTYSIDNAEQFYLDVSEITDVILDKAKDKFDIDVKKYQAFIRDFNAEENRLYSEYMIEIIMLGVFWLSYEKQAVKTLHLNSRILHKLYTLRKNNVRLKPSIDKIRGGMMSALIYHDTETGNLDFTYSSFERLLNWLNATGEFFEEAKRLNGWLQYSETLSNTEVRQILEKAYQFADWFKDTCSSKLGCYTKNVNRFVESAKTEYKNREDYGLATRKEMEYHFNIVAAEVLNRSLRDRFMNQKRKVVLLPTCMQTLAGKGCKAQSDGTERKCIACNKTCNVGLASMQLKPFGVDVYLIPHSSNFSRTLKKWQNVPDVALVGVACVLNLLLGGYEMIGLGIPSQCVYLDFCGCKKHWHSKGVPTSLNIGQLKRVLGISEPHFETKESELIALVDESDKITGYGEKMHIHRSKLLHRAFSIMIFNRKGEILVHRRALQKYHSPGLWTNACCSHLLKGHTMKEFIHNRLQYEMGIDCELTFVKKFHYDTAFDDGMTENEIDYIYCGLYNGAPLPNPSEVYEWKWCDESFLREDIKYNPENYTYWFRHIMENHLDEVKARVLQLQTI